MAVIIVLILALIHREYVPVWVTEREANHMNQVDNQFSLFKATLDNQILSGNTNLTLYSPFELGAEGVPFFSSPSSDTLFINGFDNSLAIKSGDGAVNVTAGGNVKFTASNLEYSDQALAFEFGGLLKNQSSGTSLVTTAPGFALTNSSGVVNLTMTVVTLTGASQGVSGLDSEGLLTTLQLYQQDTYAWAGGTALTLTLTTDFPAAWSTYYTGALNSKLGGGGYTVTSSGSTVTVTINSLHQLNLSLAALSVSLNL